MGGLWFCSLVSMLGVLSLLPPPPHSMWGISRTERLKGSNWSWCFKELNTCLSDFRYTKGIFKFWAWRRFLCFLCFLCFGQNGRWFSECSSPQLGLCLLGFYPLLRCILSFITFSLLWSCRWGYTALFHHLFIQKAEGNKTLDKQQGLISTVSMRPLSCSHWNPWQKSQ